ncbi:hypothetical protein ACKAV7_003229 [Fusarium commune]
MTVTDPVSPDAIRAMLPLPCRACLDVRFLNTAHFSSSYPISTTKNINPSNLVSRLNAMELSRLGTPEELAMMRRLFAVMGMHPVGYYDLTVANLPGSRNVLSTSHSQEALAYNPFRVFTSLLRLELIEDETLRTQAADILRKRNIFTDRCVELIELFESQKSFSKDASEEFIKEALETFRWHKTSTVDMKHTKLFEKHIP